MPINLLNYSLNYSLEWGPLNTALEHPLAAQLFQQLHEQSVLLSLFTGEKKSFLLPCPSGSLLLLSLFSLS